MLLQVLIVHQMPVLLLKQGPQTMKITSNNLCSAYLKERLLKKIYQMHWTAIPILVLLSKKSETVLPLYIIQEEQLVLQLQLAAVLLTKPMILVHLKMKKIVAPTAKRQIMKSNLAEFYLYIFPFITFESFGSSISFRSFLLLSPFLNKFLGSDSRSNSFFLLVATVLR